MAGALLQAIGTVLGRPYTESQLVHAVLILEQLLTTGGGWQDQVGGIIAGAKIARCKAELPLHVTFETLDLPLNFQEVLADRMVLIFTGQSRLARNVLHEVLRRWWSKVPATMEAAQELVVLAERCALALQSGDLNGISDCVNRYWELKKAMGGSSVDPPIVRSLMEKLRSSALAMSLCGAGGGGFLLVVTNKSGAYETVRSLLEEDPDACHMTLHRASIANEGLKVLIGANTGD
eukprot:CAMPEP_0185775698 /NCGR_PEP_ID=MMETSP1174-20130828/82997_1 /TAXON_ID=35687 /ORGANISM="Dictyocha speculum, Strain CCMP1381" /LENGTH=234 /DNA_ID=CAMNT_0028463363 /DNA_START=150 /DNA_END=854 /DNA_ORIENTATION=-